MSEQKNNVVSITVNKRKAADILPFIDVYIARKEEEIREIEFLVERYEKRRLAEERQYRMLSPMRKFMAGKKPDHHAAVEYIHFVKKPMEKLNVLRQEIESARRIQHSSPSDVVDVTVDLENALSM